MSEHDAEQRVREWLDTPAGYVLMPDRIATDLNDLLRQLDEARSELGKLKTEWAGRDRDWPGFDITPYSSETVARDNAEWHQEIVHRLVGEWRAAGSHHTDTTTSEGN